MATFKTCVQRPRKDGNYVVYIRITHNCSVAYINTDYLVDKKQGKSTEKEKSQNFSSINNALST